MEQLFTILKTCVSCGSNITECQKYCEKCGWEIGKPLESGYLVKKSKNSLKTKTIPKKNQPKKSDKSIDLPNGLVYAECNFVNRNTCNGNHSQLYAKFLFYILGFGIVFLLSYILAQIGIYIYKNP